MIILLTPAMLANDIVTAASYKISKILHIPMDSVKAEWLTQENNSVGLAFQVAGDFSGITEKDVQAVIESVWAQDYKLRLECALKDVKSQRK